MSAEEEKYTGKKGRKPMTDAMKGVADVKRKEGLKVDSFLPSPPDSLDMEAADEWRRVGKYLLATDRVSKIDLQSLTFYASSYSVFSLAMHPLLKGRKMLWSEVGGRAKPNKHVDLALKHGAIVVRLARKFGMTARTRHLDHSQGAGRPALPQEIHDLVKSKSRKPKGKFHIEWDEESVASPAWFDSKTQGEWVRLVDQLSAVDLWTPLDVGPVAVLCACYSLAAKCAKQLQDQPLVLPVRDSDAVVEHPLSVIYEKQFALCELIWSDYGMTPFDRQQFHHVEGEDQGKPKLSVFPGELA